MRNFYKNGGIMDFPNMLPEVTAVGKDLRSLPKPKPKYDKSYLDWFLKEPINQKEIAEIDSINATLRKPVMATGGQLTKSINNQFFPTMYNTPMLGFGDFLKNNAGSIGSVVGAVGGMFLGNPMLGAKIGGTVGGALEGDTKEQQMKQQQKMMEEQQKQVLLQSYNNGTLMANGGSLQPDNITMYAEGGSHESNPLGGIPLGDKARVEAGEVRYNSKKYGDYIFSHRLG